MNQRSLLTWWLVPYALLPLTAHAQALAVPTQGKPVRVGLIAPLTGGSADFGSSVRLGAELAVKEINESGGLPGRPLELVVRGDTANPDKGRKLSEDLVLKDKVDFTVGFCNTGVAMKSLDVFRHNKHLLMVPCSQGSAVTAEFPPQHSFIFRVALPDHIDARFLINEIVVRRKIRKVAVFAGSTGHGEGGVKDLSAELAKNGLVPVTVIRRPLGVGPLAADMRKARAARAQALVV